MLHSYALLGLLLVLPLRRASRRTLLVLMGLYLLYPVASGLLRLALVTPEVMVRLAAIAKGFEASNNAAYGQGSFWQATAEHAREFIHFYDNRWSMWIAFGWLVQLSLTMLLGLLAGRERWVQRIPALRPQLRRYSLWALAQGPGLRRGVHDDCRVQPGARAVTDQVAGRRVLLDQSAGDDDLLRAGHRAAGAAAGLADAVAA